MMEARKDDRSGMSHDIADGSHSSGFTGLSVSATMGSSPQKVLTGRSAVILQMSPVKQQPMGVFQVPLGGITAGRYSVAPHDSDRSAAGSSASLLRSPRVFTPVVALPFSGQMKLPDGKLFRPSPRPSQAPKVTVAAYLPRSFNESANISASFTTPAGLAAKISSHYSSRFPDGLTPAAVASSSALLDMKRMVESSVDKSPIKPGTFATNSSSLSLSPRPTILRKRPFVNSSPTHPQLPVVGGNKFSSLDSQVTRQLFSHPTATVSSATGERQRLTASDLSFFWMPPNRPKFDPHVETPESSSSNESSSTTVSATSEDGKSDQLEISPRKRPRKQQLKSDVAVRKSVQQEMKTDLQCNEKFEDFDDFPERNRFSSRLDVGSNDVRPKTTAETTTLAPPAVVTTVPNNGIRSIREGAEYRPRPSLLRCLSGSSRYLATRHHFLHYDDVKVKEEKPLGMVEMANQNFVVGDEVCRLKTVLLMRQIRDIARTEAGNAESLSHLLSDILDTDNSSTSDDTTLRYRTAELVRENLQRCKVITEETEGLAEDLKRIFSHQSSVEELLLKYRSKRPYRAKTQVALGRDEPK